MDTKDNNSFTKITIELKALPIQIDPNLLIIESLKEQNTRCFVFLLLKYKLTIQQYSRSSHE